VKIRFADCRLDTDARRLWRGTREVHLSPKAFELLKLLVEEHPRALSKAALLERVWPDVFVSDASLARVVNEIREAVGDRARSSGIVRTVHRYGYAFGAELEDEGADGAPAAPGGASRATCWLIRESRTYPLADGEHMVGREPASSVWLDSPKVSRHHARIVVSAGRATIEDAGSKNGTFVGDLRIEIRTTLQSGDTIRIGPFTLIFRVVGGLFTTETETAHL